MGGTLQDPKYWLKSDQQNHWSPHELGFCSRRCNILVSLVFSHNWTIAVAFLIVHARVCLLVLRRPVRCLTPR